jgi:hypothetical protein
LRYFSPNRERREEKGKDLRSEKKRKRGEGRRVTKEGRKKLLGEETQKGPSLLKWRMWCLLRRGRERRR